MQPFSFFSSNRFQFVARVARFFVVQNTKWVDNIPKNLKITLCPKIHQMVVKQSKWLQNMPTFFHSKALKI
jgi:hypothetical protein